eukprot:m.435980 g.435980  ORF g.435980 m.435980 type:complete len:85 (+) comp17922_c0_seq1:1144-1398(+)
MAWRWVTSVPPTAISRLLLTTLQWTSRLRLRPTSRRTVNPSLQKLCAMSTMPCGPLCAGSLNLLALSPQATSAAAVNANSRSAS